MPWQLGPSHKAKAIVDVEGSITSLFSRAGGCPGAQQTNCHGRFPAFTFISHIHQILGSAYLLRHTYLAALLFRQVVNGYRPIDLQACLKEILRAS